MLFLISCSNQPKNKLIEVFNVIGYDHMGNFQVENTIGDAAICSNGKEVRVVYIRLDDVVIETGTLENIKLINKGKNNSYSIVADWIRRDSVNGRFSIDVFDLGNSKTMLYEIEGSSWKYYVNLKISDNDYKKLVEILKVQP